MVKHLSLCLLLASTAALSLTSGGQAPKDGEARKKEVTTVQYGVKDLVGSNVIWRGRAGEKERQVDGSDDIIRLIVEHVNPKEWRGDQSSILEVNGTALEIRTTKANHAEIADLFAALRRSADVQVVAESGLYAVDRAFYEKEFAPQFIKNRSRPLALDLKEQDQLLKASRTEKLNKVKLSNGGRGQVFSLRRAVAYEWLPPLGASKKAEVALVGVSLELEGRVSGDRRFVRMTLTQRGAELLETRKEVTKC